MPVTIQRADGGKNPKLAFQSARLLMPATARRANDAAAKAVEKSVLLSMRTVAPTGRLRNVGKTGAPLTTRIYKAGSAEQPQSVLKAVGPWQFIENDTKAHVILPKSFGSRRTRRQIAEGLFTRAAGRRLSRGRRTGGDAFIGAQHAGALKTPRGPRVYVRHPGTKGKHPWKHGVERGAPAASLAWAQAVRADLRRQFG